jgi:hypothetical protein
MNINFYLSDVRNRLSAILSEPPGMVPKQEAEGALESLQYVVRAVQEGQGNAVASGQRAVALKLQALARMDSCADLLEQAISLSGEFIGETAERAVPEEAVRGVIAKLRDPYLTE